MARRKPHVLIVQGAHSDADAVEAALRGAGLRFASDRVGHEQDPWDAIRERAKQDPSPDVVVMDHPRAEGRQREFVSFVLAMNRGSLGVVVGDAATKQAVARLVEAGLCSFVPEDELEKLGPAVKDAIRQRRKRVADVPLDELLSGDWAFAMLSENTSEGVSISEYDPVTAERQFLFCNDRYVEMSGYSRQELQDAEAFDTLSEPLEIHMPEGLDYYTALLLGLPLRGVVTWHRPDGAENYCEWKGVARRHGRTFYIMGVDRDVTGQRQAERALRESQERFHAMLQNARDVAYEVDLQSGAFSYASPSVEGLLGLTPSEVVQLGPRKMLRRIHPDDVRPFRTRTETLLSSPDPDVHALSVEYRLQHKDGHYVWVSDSRRVVTDSKGKPIAIVGVARDVTARRRAEEAHRDQARPIREELLSLDTQVYVKDQDLRFVFVNEAFSQQMGTTPEEVIGKTGSEFFPSGMARSWQSDDRRVMQAGRPETRLGVEAYPHGDGVTVAQWTKVPLMASDGQAVGLVCVRSWPEARAGVADQFAHLASLVEWSDDAVMGLGTDGTIVSWNPGAERMYGYTAEEVRGQSVTLLSSPARLDDLKRAIRRVARGESTRNVETVHLASDTRAVNVALTMSPVLDADGAVIAISASAHDITERNKAEEALRQSEERFRLLAETAFDGINICEIDLEAGRRRLVFCNDRFVEMSGYTHEELANADDLNALQEAIGTDEERKEWDRRLAQGLPYSGTASWKRPDGKENYHEWSAIRVKVGDGYRLFGVDRDITERVQAERALRESEERFRLLAETAWDGLSICTLGPTTGSRKLVFCNDRYVEMSGYSREELEAAEDLTKLTVDRYTPESWTGVMERFREGVPVTDVASWDRPDGKENYYEWSAICVRAGDEYRIIGVDRDITERMRAEEALRYRVELEHLITTISSSFINLSHDEIDDGIDTALRTIGEFAQVDRAYVFQFSADGRHARNTHEWCAEGIEPQMDDLQRIRLDEELPWFAARIRNNEALYVPSVDELPAEAILERAHFEEQAIRSLIVVPMVSAGKSVGFVGFDSVRQQKEWTEDATTLLRILSVVLCDTLERKRAEEALSENERFLANVFGSIQDGLSVLDHDMRIVRVNPTMEKRYAHAMPLVGRKCYEAYHGRSRPCEMCPSERTLATGEAAHEVQALSGPRGKPRGWLDVYSFPLVDPQTGELEGVIEYVRDISDRVQAKEQLARYAERLETLNAELERSNRDLEDFTHTVSHDLQEPLRKVHAFGQFLVEDCGDALPAEGRRHLQHMQEAAVRMKRLVEHLLAIARVGSGGSEVTPVDSGQILDSVLVLLAPSFEEAGLEVRVGRPLPAVIADAVQLGQVFQNLLGNVSKFRSPDRPPKVVISATAQDGWAHFQVSDNGIGIEERFLEKIFGLFQRLHPRDEYDGDGVGLALCEKVIRHHKGKVWAESEFGKGSTFHFTLPVPTEGKDEAVGAD